MANGYDVQVEDELRHIDMVKAGRLKGTSPPELPVRPGRTVAKLWLDCFLAFLILALPASFMISTPLFVANIAAAMAIVCCGYLRLVWLILVALGPPDSPRVIAIIKAPDRLFCPRCGEPRTKKYCSGCGANTEREYRKLVRQLAQYAVEDTQEQRLYLEQAIQAYLSEVAEKQRKEISVALEKLERTYVMEIARHRKALREYQRCLTGPVSSERTVRVGEDDERRTVLATPPTPASSRQEWGGIRI